MVSEREIIAIGPYFGQKKGEEKERKETFTKPQNYQHGQGRNFKELEQSGRVKDAWG